MIDLQEYGFKKIAENDRWTDYQGHDFTVTIYNYMITTFDKCEVSHNAFVVSSKQFTSRSRPTYELADWLMEKNIQKK